MRVSAERDECASTGQCIRAVPSVFRFDGEGVVMVVNENPSDGEARAVREAVRSCPTQALVISED